MIQAISEKSQFSNAVRQADMDFHVDVAGKKQVVAVAGETVAFAVVGEMVAFAVAVEKVAFAVAGDKFVFVVSGEMAGCGMAGRAERTSLATQQHELVADWVWAA